MNPELRTIYLNLELAYKTGNWDIVNDQISRLAFFLADSVPEQKSSENFQQE